MKHLILPITAVLTFFGFSQVALADMAISSSSFADGKISKVHACTKMGGKNQSPPVSISGLPSDATHIAIIMDDPDAKSVAGKTWVHWNVFNIKAEGDGYSIDAAKKPNGLIGKNSGGSGYGGMCPPNGKHTYRLAAFALKDEVKVKASGWSGKAYTIEKFEKDFKGSILAKAMITGDFK
jgi:Raf kinase inhibitor-like YbhB/YbcL family protein